MDASREASQLLANPAFLKRLPPGVVEILHSGSNDEYLNSLSLLALQPSTTPAIFSIHRALSVELCARWTQYSTPESKSVEIFATFARMLPIAPYLSPYVERLLQLQTEGLLTTLCSKNIYATSEFSEVHLRTVLLALYRLLQFDNNSFAYLVSPAQLQLHLTHPERPIRYLAVRILCLYLHASESTLQEMVRKYIGPEEMNGHWDDKIIDYRFFSLWEEQRLKTLRKELQRSQGQSQEDTAVDSSPAIRRVFASQDFSPGTVCLAGVLIPSSTSEAPVGSSLVMTQTVKRNMQSLAEAIKTDRPMLLTGPMGAGKTSLIREAAKQLAFGATMIVLHLNEQIDAKLLIGMYTTTGGPGSFTWQPGVLTKAVIEGRWVLLEDFDRAPAEIVSMILPLLERRELLVPHWGETIRAAPGFRLIATMRSSKDAKGGKVLPRRTILGSRHWNLVHLQSLPDQELGEIVMQRFPTLYAYVPRILGLYARMRRANSGRNFLTGSLDLFGRPPGPQDLFRWCSRIHNLLQSAGVMSGSEPISETANDGIFLEAVDCFAGRLPDGDVKNEMVAIIAQELQVSTERVSFCLKSRQPDYSAKDKILRIGRTSLPKQRPEVGRGATRKHKLSPFAMTNRVLRHLESVAVAIKLAEPCLLVGETGSGKTTIIQQLAESLNHKLVVVNLSQQSEAGDLLGGFKPVNIRALAIPMKEEFDNLFQSSFSSKKNQRYIDHIGKAISKDRWSRALTLWREATKMVELSLQSPQTETHIPTDEPASKRRKVDNPKLQALGKRWEAFAGQLNIFQKHVESGSKGFAFSFVEGNIVKAARNGDWVLLDEINLAAPDTLDSLADLLAHDEDYGPSLLLTETGKTERIRAHRNFRIFGAMNPASDVGKRDLPLSLRSRFTELFIDPPDKDLDNLIPLVRAYLGNNNHADARIFGDVAHLYLDIQGLACANQLVDGADQKPHFSLRTLTRTLMYVLDIAPTYGLRRALFEGFSMSFLTLLNHASILRVLTLMENHLLKNQKNSRALLLRVPKPPSDAEQFVQFRQYWIKRGSAEVKNQPHYIITPFIEKNLMNLVRATSTRRFPVLLQGPTSSGKTSMVEYLANISGNKFVRINNHEHTDLQEYLGTYVSGPNGELQYQEGILVQALREGFWIVLDELNLAPTDVLEALNRLLDDNRELFIPETQKIVRPHEDFMLFATQNPPGIYGGRKVLSRAFRNRFLELHFDDIPEDELEVILRERSQIAPSFCAKIVAVYKKLSLYRQHSRLFEQKNSFATLRDLFRWAFRDADDREQLAVNGYYLLAERVRDDEERQVVKRTIEEVMKTKIDDNVVYSITKLHSRVDLVAAAHGIVWTKSMRRLYILVTEALKTHEPVLLVGETGSGKTTVCQVIAAAMQTQLHIINAHQNMETGDLIGSQRPVRSRQSIETRLREQLHEILEVHLDPTDISDNSLQTLVRLYRDLPTRLVEEIPLQSRQKLDQSLAQFNALFEWVDGSLVRAMKAGHHFLLDEISLADDSVLERMNSVLEPSRNIFLAEKGISDSLVTAAEGFHFLATMNPGGDYGKKELSPALRNRFTEIWVPNVSEHDEMQEILEQKLGQSYKHFAQQMVAFAHWYSGKFANTTTQISIRDLLAWVDFLNSRCILDENHSLLHGAALVYIDALGANPAAKLNIQGSSVKEQRQLCLSKLSELFEFDMAKFYWQAIELESDLERLIIGPFDLRRYPHASMDPQYSLKAPTTVKNAMMIARALQLARPILLEGSPGVGKTTLVAALAQACGMPLTRLNLSDQTDLVDLFGSDVPVEGGLAGQFQWREAPFLRAMQKGEWVLLDEMNLASQSVLEGLNACFDHRGQVYVSELEQTFTRHPNFVVFAAQNPHHQGSGRKGLPTSFVNRFTVVYADTFKADDLLMICSEKFSSMPSAQISMLTECVAELGVSLQQQHQSGMRGGPWEINLRDTTRWLDLLASKTGFLSAGKPEDYVAMLFSQRFRRSEDASLLIELLGEHLSGSVPFQNRVVGVQADYVQVGLALLPRRLISSCSLHQNHYLPFSHLPLVESVMLCVQKSWPVLLVGPSGSGKTEMIKHLASCIGTDLVELSINADMDTTDLVGGYEQSDCQRQKAAFIRRLGKFTKQTRLRSIELSHLASYESLAELESLLIDSSSTVERIVEVLHKVVNEDPGLGFAAYLHESIAIVEQSLHDSRARFEWVDGILVESIVEGKWLILDNANLCSPSVLDRLNSLLEPNGVLIINERRSSDGSARVVTPHPNFRIFLTMDPQHGELSRAMRNRNIELYMPMPEAFRPYNGISLMFDSAMMRFLQFQTICSASVQDSDFHEFVWICLDHLAYSDHDLIKSWSEQIRAGLLDISSDQHRALLSVVRLFEQLLASGRNTMQEIKDAYCKFARQSGLPLGFEATQTIQPLNNSKLVALDFEANHRSDLFRLGIVVDLLLDVNKFEYVFASVTNDTRKQPPSTLSRLQRSIVNTTSRRFNEDSIKPLAPLLVEGLNVLRLKLGRADECVTVPSGLRQSVYNADLAPIKTYFIFLVELFEVTHSNGCDEAVLMLYLESGKDVITGLKSQPFTAELAATLERGLDRFNPFWQLNSGQSMELIWSHLKPSTPTTSHQLDLNVHIEQLADRFDDLLWTSNLSFSRMNEIKRLLVKVGQVAEISDCGTTNSLKVNPAQTSFGHRLNLGQDVTKALDDIETERNILTGTISPYFQSEFETLRQYLAASTKPSAVETEFAVGLVSGQPTKELWQQCTNIVKLTGVGKKHNALATIRRSFPVSVLQKLYVIRGLITGSGLLTLSSREYLSEVPLRSLDLLKDEVKLMAMNTAKLTSIITGDQQSMLHHVLRKMHHQIAIAHRQYLQPYAHPETDVGLTIWQMSEKLPSSHYLRDVVAKFLQPSWVLVAPGQNHRALIDTSTAWILFFTGCLSLYLPDHPYDPAIKPRVARDRHRNRAGVLRMKLSALQQFERLTTGQSTNLRCSILEKELESLGAEPAVQPILRPDNSQLGQLQSEFNNILQSIVGRSPDQKKLAQLYSGDTSAVFEIELLRSNITQAISRLVPSYRMYDDITRPLIEMLHGLDAGLAMAAIATAPKNPQARFIELLCRSTPFFGMRINFLDQEEHDEAVEPANALYDPRLKFGESFAVMYSMTKSTEHNSTLMLFKIFHTIYEDWKQQLGEDQQKDLAKSSMYRYRGAEADVDANDEGDFHELFPDFEKTDNHLAAGSMTQHAPRETAQRLARLQRTLFESELNPVDQIQGIMRSSCSDMARMWEPKSTTRKSPMTTQDMLCGLILGLDRNVDRLSIGSYGPSSYNFYSDPNLTEAQKLVSIVRRVQTRFLELKQAWPEHSTLDDVLTTTTELLILRHTEPVAKLIIKVEQLHEYVHQWQMVASREFSALALYDQLTALIVAWRRLELLTWSQLFNMEDSKCEEEVDSWWFVAYEAIVAAPLSILESGDELQEHVQNLYKTLQDFIINSSIGHCSLRIRMLQSYKEYVALIQQSTPGFAIVHSTLSNFLAFYSRYMDPVKQAIQTGKLALEKEMKDVLLLASWKDTNVNALRDSAKRSHHKLFKIVRKYRALLARTAQSTIEQGFPEFSAIPQGPPALKRNSLHSPDPCALQTCQDLLNHWSERPARFRNTTTTVASMVSMSHIHPSMVDLLAYLHHVRTDFSEDVESLRKETPSIATEDNADLLKHLTSRKRKLFSDVLKGVRHMGFRSNLSADVLSQQASPAVILTRIPPLEATDTSQEPRAAEYHLHQFLRLMDTVREASRAHSEDLNGSEVARSIGYFESVLSAVIKQRTVFGDLATGLRCLNRNLEKMQNVWKPESYRIMLHSYGRDTLLSVKRAVSCVPHIIDTGCLIIEKHGKLGQLDHSSTLTSLREWSTQFKTLAATVAEEPSLPDQLTSTQHQSNHARAQLLLADLKADLQNKAQEYPDLAFVYRQIQLWTDTSDEVVNGHSDHVASLKLKDFDQHLLSLCDSILVAIQAFEKTTTEIVSSDDRSWFVKSEKALENGVKALHVAKIAGMINEVLSDLCHMSYDDQSMATALTALALPIVCQYRDICHNVLDYTSKKSVALNKWASTLAQSFCQITSQGFCGPPRSGAPEGSKDEKLEEGTGLGEGEGAEDISKDIQDDEDLTELAHEGQKSNGEEIADQEDAVNMDQDDLEGEMGAAEEKYDDGDEASEAASDEEGIDEEAGDVDDLDPHAVDEKLWDGDGNESGKEKEGQKTKGASRKDDKAPAAEDNKGADADEEELSETGAEEGEKIEKQEGEMMDSHAQQEDNLDLPDEMDLDGPDKASVGSDIEDSDLDGLSNAGTEGEEGPDQTGSDFETDEEAGTVQDQVNHNQQDDAESERPEDEKADQAGSPVDTEPEDTDEPSENLLQNHTDDAIVDKDNIAPSDAQGLDGQGANEDAEIEMQENKASGGIGNTNQEAQTDQQPQAAAKEGELGNLQDQSQDASDSRDPISEDHTSQAFKKLGDALETWHRQQRKIQDAQSSPGREESTGEADMTKTEFQHLDDENAKADTQALGAATEDQANALDQRALDSEMQDQPQDLLPDEAEENPDEDTTMEESDSRQIPNASHQEQPKPSTFIGPTDHQRQTQDPHSTPLRNENELQNLDTSLSLTHLHPPSPPPEPRSLTSARALWTHHSNTISPLSQLLTSQLQLILTPTLATKMRGDFRTGKRLNIKRIIPYIASDFKRDKIWMRRSIPSKRNYQIMLAVDDSKSMAGLSGGGEGLAFETLALVAKSLSMLEVGELCIVGFGDHVTVAHAFDQPFTDEAGVAVFRQFGFQQPRTDILKLVEESMGLFREARRRDMAVNAGEIWQLELIISDGVCEDHEAIRRLVRQATEERIMIVFIIVDSINAGPTNGDGKGQGTSIVDMQTAVFEADGEEGEKRLKIKRYLDGFPFGYYVVVGD
ncbi:MAG: hypothetical protein Q9224_000432, partial [Gallowayella concinna]